MKILIIEDDVEIRDTLQELLEVNGHQTLVAASGAEGVTLADSQPDLILCDVAMPGLSGYEVLAAVRQREHGRMVPFVFLTARAARADQRHGMALGADDYITKPFSEKELLEAVEARTRRHRTLRERVDTLTEQRRRQADAGWSHELLTPLNGMIGGLQLLEMEVETMSRDDLKQIIGLIRGSVERQEKLSRKLIRYFDLERLKETPRTGTRARCSVAAAVWAGSQNAAAGTRREPDIAVNCEPGTVPLPESLLESAVGELVDNALRFSNPGQAVTVTGQRQGEEYHITVCDRGLSMTAEERASIGPFTQFGRNKREQQGLGLGLAIVRSVAQYAGGRLALDSGPGDVGLAVTLQLPTQG